MWWSDRSRLPVVSSITTKSKSAWSITKIGESVKSPFRPSVNASESIKSDNRPLMDNPLDHDPPPYESMFEEQSTEDAGFWDNQWITLGLGLLCGIVANVLVKRYAATGTETMGNTPSTGLRAFSTQNKMALVIRHDLGMTKGKVASQCAHAAIMCYKKALREQTQFVKQWETFGQAKVTLKVNSEAELLGLQAQAQAVQLTACVVRDAGRTQIDPGSPTVLGIGPGPNELVDSITGHLKLY